MNFTVKKKESPKSCATISLRINKELLAEIDQLASDNNRSRTEIIVSAIEYAMNNLDEKNKKHESKEE